MSVSSAFAACVTVTSLVTLPLLLLTVTMVDRELLEVLASAVTVTVALLLPVAVETVHQA